MQARWHANGVPCAHVGALTHNSSDSLAASARARLSCFPGQKEDLFSCC